MVACYFGRGNGECLPQLAAITTATKARVVVVVGPS